MVKVAYAGDSPRKTTGFAQVSKRLLSAFYLNDWDVYAFGTMDDKPCVNGLPYHMFTTYGNNPYEQYAYWLAEVKPDVIVILYDPAQQANFVQVVDRLVEAKEIKRVPVVLYTPIEGYPVPSSTASLFSRIKAIGGKVVLYSPGAVEMVQRQYAALDELEWAYHGLDHAAFRPLEPARREELRDIAGWGDQFVVGCVGTNKRTKAFDQVIYTARYLRDTLQDSNIKFYMHTNHLRGTLSGYNLLDMANQYGVADMMIWKPDKEEFDGGNIEGCDRETRLEDLKTRPHLGSIGYIERMGMLDAFLDLSQLEGWGLPLHEAMRCGVPSITVKDGSIREEIMGSGAVLMEPIPWRMWPTLYTGVKLPIVDPAVAAHALMLIKDGERCEFSKIALDNAIGYNWGPTEKKLIDIIESLL